MTRDDRRARESRATGSRAPQVLTYSRVLRDDAVRRAPPGTAYALMSAQEAQGGGPGLGATLKDPNVRIVATTLDKIHADAGARRLLAEHVERVVVDEFDVSFQGPVDARPLLEAAAALRDEYFPGVPLTLVSATGGSVYKRGIVDFRLQEPLVLRAASRRHGLVYRVAQTPKKDNLRQSGADVIAPVLRKALGTSDPGCGALVFANTPEEVELLAKFLRARGLPDVHFAHGRGSGAAGADPGVGDAVLRWCDGAFPILVATSVSARAAQVVQNGLTLSRGSLRISLEALRFPTLRVSPELSVRVGDPLGVIISRRGLVRRMLFS